MTFAVAPLLDAAAGERIVVLLDGKVVASGSTVNFALRDGHRGSHVLQARMVSNGERVPQVSPQGRSHLWRASRLLPGPSR